MSRTSSSKSVIIKNGRASAIMKPQLTSLIDVMTILLVFLLKSFSVDGNLVTVSKDLNLANSTSDITPVPALNIEVNPDQIVVDGAPLMSLEKVATSDSMLVEELYNALTEAAGSLRMLSNKGRIIIQCDSVVDFKVLKKIMYTCGKAEFSNFSLLVQEKV
ncbi:MAG: biopolymer transporter ExbD [Fibrobacteria bacterium]|nr:biopolymer transporter ExbD [Fibrobacteria bacterium]